jgi:formylglycine-generating enzyme required for sulfatase activity
LYSQSRKSSKKVVLIKAATFTMGTAAGDVDRLETLYGVKRSDLFSGEVPAHRVKLSAYLIDKYEVTNRDFAKFLRAEPTWLPGRIPAKYDNGNYLKGWTDGKYSRGEAELPVTNVNWYAAASYCNWAGKRLPTEAEWEYAARGGLQTAEFPWGNAKADPTVANYGKSGFGKPVKVGSYAPNGYGLYDMAGNVWEFTADEWAKYRSREAEDPMAGANIFTSMNFDLIATRRVIRGGSWGGAPLNLRVAYRDSHPPNGSQPFVGFRCAMSAKTDSPR